MKSRHSISWLWLLLSFQSRSSTIAEDNIPVPITTPPQPPAKKSELEQLADHLRSDDKRLVRYDAEDELVDLQSEDDCDSGLNEAFQALATKDKPIEEMIAAAQVITLCSTDNPVNRAKLSKQDNAVFQTLVSMIRMPTEEGNMNPTTVSASAAASETVWITSFSNKNNIHSYIEADVLPALSSVIVSPACADACHIAKMWAAAALQNLAASYCNTDWGGCDWQWVKEEDGEYYLTTDPEASPTTVNGEAVRQMILEDTKLFQKLIELACAGPVKKPHRAGEYPWPSRAEASSDVDFPSVVPWAAAGALRNLILSTEYPDTLSKDVDCFCSLVDSPDGFESGKAEEALYRIGLAVEDCPLPYAADCEDVADWKSEDGSTCEMYEENAWCIEFGHIRDKPLEQGGLPASEACCMCGGGIKTATMKEDEDESEDKSEDESEDKSEDESDDESEDESEDDSEDGISDEF